MAYKQSPLTMIQGTAGHKSALKAISPLKQSYPSSAQFGPHGPKGTLTEVKRIANQKIIRDFVKKNPVKPSRLQKLKKIGGKVWKGVKGVGKRVAGPVGAAMIGWDIGKVTHRMVRKNMNLGEALKDYYLGPKEKGQTGIKSDYYKEQLSKYNDAGQLKAKNKRLKNQ